VQLTVPKVLVATVLAKVVATAVVEIVPGDASVTRAVHVVAWLIATVAGVHVTAVVVVRVPTVIGTVLPLLVA